MHFFRKKVLKKFASSKIISTFATANKPSAICPDGGIGRRAGLKHQWSNPSRFDPGSGKKAHITTTRGVGSQTLRRRSNPRIQRRERPRRPYSTASAATPKTRTWWSARTRSASTSGFTTAAWALTIRTTSPIHGTAPSVESSCRSNEPSSCVLFVILFFLFFPHS